MSFLFCTHTNIQTFEVVIVRTYKSVLIGNDLNSLQLNFIFLDQQVEVTL